MECASFFSESEAYWHYRREARPDVAEKVAQGLSPEARKAISEKLRSHDPMELASAIQEVGKLRAEGASFLDELIPILSSKDHNIANQTALVIGAMGPSAFKAAPALLANMNDQEAKTDQQEFLWISFSRALFGLGPKVIPILVEGIEKSNPIQFAGICGALHDFGTAAKPALTPILRKAESDHSLLWPALYVLEAIGKPSVQGMPLLIKALQDENFQNQLIACRVIAAIGPEAKEAKPILLKLAMNGNTSCRGRAAIALGSIGASNQDREQIVETLKILLSDPNQVVRERAMVGIGRLGPDARDLIEDVRKALHDPKFSAKSEACVALWRISGNPDDSVQRLIQLLDKIDHDLHAIVAIGEMGPDGMGALPALLKKMESEDMSYALEGCNTIAKMGPVARDALPKLIQLCDAEDPDVRIAARAARIEVER